MSASPTPSTTPEASTPTPLSKSTPAGRLVLVVGASGVGKDTLIDGARAALAGDAQILFARREITRPADAGGEDHLAVDDEDFETRLAAGQYLLAWRAHGLSYGLPASLAAELAVGRTVVANGSRTVLEEARTRVSRLTIISVVADPAVVAARLALRGRETAADIAARLKRAGELPVVGADVVELRNEGTPAEGVRRLVEAIRDSG
jgi:ribose 1,5-bisphosphokinase